MINAEKLADMVSARVADALRDREIARLHGECDALRARAAALEAKVDELQRARVADMRWVAMRNGSAPAPPPQVVQSPAPEPEYDDGEIVSRLAARTAEWTSKFIGPSFPEGQMEYPGIPDAESQQVVDLGHGR